MFLGAIALYIGSFVAVAGALAVPRRDNISANARPIVDLGYAKYQGIRPDDGVDQFLGMRYANAPLGNLRFRAPEDPVPEPNVQDASKYGPNCLGVSEVSATPETPSSTAAEDCLFVNVFKPSNETEGSNLPVWIWITGGGYANDAWANFDGTDLLYQSSNSIVFVEFTYRAGALGFLASEQVRQDGDLNVGLLDQRKLLHWVQMYIHKFGGDPKKVVIHGASAGAGSVAYHLTAYAGRKDNQLFAGAIAQDSFWPPQRTVAEMEFQYWRLLSKTNCSTLDCLRSVDIDSFQAATGSEPFPDDTSDNFPPLFYWLPVIDDELVPDRMYNLFEQGDFIRVPLLVGDDTNEGSQYAFNASNPSEVSKFLKSNYPNLLPSQLEEINNVYPRMEPLPQHDIYFPSASAAYGDLTFTCPGNEIASSLARYYDPQKVWNYRYNVRDPETIAKGLGVHHDQEWWSIFGPVQRPEMEPASDNTTNAIMVPITKHYWMSFVRSLNPNTFKVPMAPQWQPWGSGTGQRLRLQTNSTEMEPVPQDLTEKCAFWRRLAGSTEQ